MDISGVKKVHFIGIGGIGISALARLMLHAGYEVSGTNDSPSPETLDELRNKGVQISLDQSPERLPKADMYVYSDAWLTNNPVILDAARATGAPTLSYFEALGAITKKYKLVAVAGTHGKTTTTAMVADVLEAAGIDPTVVVGSLRAKTGSNFAAGAGEWFVVEADEYRRHFLQFTPAVLIITNIDAAHLDYYKDLADVQSAFAEVIAKIGKDGVVVCNPHDPHVAPVVASVLPRVVDYTLAHALTLKVPGVHNVKNAQAAHAAAEAVGVADDVIHTALETFAGTWRRLEYKGKMTTGADLYDDYAHEPQEIAASLAAIRSVYPAKKIWAVFQPHLFSRTKTLLHEFATSFTDANAVLVSDIYPAREPFDATIHSKDVVKEVLIHQNNALYVSTLSDLEKKLKEETRPEDVVIVMGAGSIYELPGKLTK